MVWLLWPFVDLRAKNPGTSRIGDRGLGGQGEYCNGMVKVNWWRRPVLPHRLGSNPDASLDASLDVMGRNRAGRRKFNNC
jgi:hypothetical protein